MPIHNYGAATASKREGGEVAKRFAGRMNYVVNAAHTKQGESPRTGPGLLSVVCWARPVAGWPVDAAVISMVNENTASCKLAVASWCRCCTDAAAAATAVAHCSSSSSRALISK